MIGKAEQVVHDIKGDSNVKKAAFATLVLFKEKLEIEYVWIMYVYNFIKGLINKKKQQDEKAEPLIGETKDKKHDEPKEKKHDESKEKKDDGKDKKDKHKE
jgi:hypothetical protein